MRIKNRRRRVFSWEKECLMKGQFDSWHEFRCDEAERKRNELLVPVLRCYFSKLVPMIHFSSFSIRQARRHPVNCRAVDSTLSV